MTNAMRCERVVEVERGRWARRARVRVCSRDRRSHLYARIDDTAPLVWTIEGVLTREECAELIARASAIGFEPASIAYRDGARMNREVRNNERVELEDARLCALLWTRVRAQLPPIHGEQPSRLNERLRVYRYRPGERFALHRDGSIELEGGETSRLTLLVYLDEDVEGGETFFAKTGMSIAPRTGLAVFFQHSLLHESRPVTRGIKHALRTDVFYRAAG